MKERSNQCLTFHWITYFALYDGSLIRFYDCYLSHLMRLWHFSSSVNSFFKHAQPSSGARCLIFGRILLYVMCANSEGSGETVRMRRLVWAFDGRLCDKNHNLMSWLICQCVRKHSRFFFADASVEKQKLPKEQLIQLPRLFTSSYFHHQYPTPLRRHLGLHGFARGTLFFERIPALARSYVTPWWAI